MARIPPESAMFPRRGVSLKGRFYSAVIGDKLVVKKWPRRQPTARTQAEADNRTALAKAARFTAYMSVGSQTFAADVARRCKLLPRDLLMICLFNRLGYVVLNDGRKIFSMAAMQNVSELLDALGQTPGDLLYRGDDWWINIPIGIEGQVLTVGPANTLEWTTIEAGGGGGEPFMLPPALRPGVAGATIGPDQFVAYPIFPNADLTIQGLKLWITAIGSSRQIKVGLYTSNGLTMAGGTLLQETARVTPTVGLNSFLFPAPEDLTANTFYWIGVLVRGGSGNLQAMLSDQGKEGYQYFTNAADALPATAPAITNGVGGTQFTWYGY